ncbi:helix-turn-helix transcriptional regulator [Streptomyces sp. B22F1]|uniref:helix-turn-helix domain-containing protein n=1 Tax=Streptomyces sp. B22F1 TaxID=3153566 RepID=UPI00325D4702
MSEQAGEGADQEKQDARETLAHALVTLRKKAGKSLSQLAEDTGYERSYLNRLENGERISKRPVMEDLDSYYGTDGLLVKLWKSARNSVIVNRYKLFIRYEEGAVIMHKYMTAIPGLLQTEDYARAVLSSSPNHGETDWLEEQVTLRLSRQELLQREPPPSLRVILDEAALRRPTADAKVWAAQLAHLLESAERPSTVIQVLPFTAGVHDLLGGSLSLLWQADGMGVVYLEGSKSGDLVEDAKEVAQYRLSYDQLRDVALPPPAHTTSSGPSWRMLDHE